MTTTVFVDTTTLLYSQDRRFPAKQQCASAWLNRLVDTNRMAVSLQVLNETYAVVRRKAPFGHWRAAVRPFLTDLLFWTLPPLTGEALSEAWRLEESYGIGFWDAMLLVSANRGGCEIFLSEDLNDGQAYGSVKAVNPFRHAPDDVLGPALAR